MLSVCQSADEQTVTVDAYDNDKKVNAKPRLNVERYHYRALCEGERRRCRICDQSLRDDHKVEHTFASKSTMQVDSSPSPQVESV